MSVRAFLPSAQFLTILGALLVSGGLVVAAQYVTKSEPTTITTGGVASPLNADWQKELDAIQASSGINAPQPPDQETVATLTESVKTSNLTDSIAKTLLIKLTNAKAQGLAEDIPTEEQLIAEASASAASSVKATYSQKDLASIAPGAAAMKAYGNKVPQIIALYPQANAAATLQNFGYVIDYGDAKKLAPLVTAEDHYTALAKSLVSVSVPSTLAPLHLQMINDFASMASDIEDMRTVLSDPLRGLRGLQGFTARMDELTRVLTTIAGNLSKNGILFNKDEPGSAWSVFVSSSVTQ